MITPLKRIFDRAVEDYGISGELDDYSFGAVGASQDPLYNTKITITAKDQSVFKGSKTLHYNRIDLDTVVKGLVMSIYEKNVYDAIEAINQCTELDISNSDVYNDNVPSLSPTGDVRVGVLRAKAESLFYIGETELEYSYPTCDEEESELVIISKEYEGDIRESARAYTADGSVNQYFYYLGNITDFSEVSVENIYNARGGLTYMTGYFDLSYHLFDEDHHNVTGRTLVMDHYGMIMKVIDEEVFTEEMLNTFVYSSGFVYFIGENKEIKRFKHGMVVDDSFELSTEDGFDYIEAGSDLEIYGASVKRVSDEKSPVTEVTVKKYAIEESSPDWSLTLKSSGLKINSNPLLAVDGCVYLRSINLDSSDNQCLFGGVATKSDGPLTPFTRISRNGDEDKDYEYHLKGVSGERHRSKSETIEWSFKDQNSLVLLTDNTNPITGFVSPVASRFNPNGYQESSVHIGCDIPPLERVKVYDNKTDILIVRGFNAESNLDEIHVLNKRTLRSICINPYCTGGCYLFVQRLGDII